MKTSSMFPLFLFVVAFMLLFVLPIIAQTPATLPVANASLLMFSVFVGAIFRPVIEYAVSRISSIPNNVAGALTFGLFALVYLVGWATLGGKGGTPSDLVSWAQGALDAVGSGSVVMSSVGVKKAASGEGS